MKEKEIKIIPHDSIDIQKMSEAEQRTFFATLLARVLELYREQKKEAE